MGGITLSNWYGKGCDNQICQFEGWYTPEGYEEDRSEPVLVFCKAQEGTEHDHEGNCQPEWCPLKKNKGA